VGKWGGFIRFNPILGFDVVLYQVIHKHTFLEEKSNVPVIEAPNLIISACLLNMAVKHQFVVRK
jgi:hypothetical protein